MLVSGLAALWDEADLDGDTVRAGAFALSLRERGLPRMLLGHDPRRPAGRWTAARETARGLELRGLVTDADAQAALREGLSGLSIGFIAQSSRGRACGGRELCRIALHEVSLVRRPVQPLARLEREGPAQGPRAPP